MTRYLLRERASRLLLERMSQGAIADGLHGRYLLNPEDLDDMAYAMLSGLLGRDCSTVPVLGSLDLEREIIDGITERAWLIGQWRGQEFRLPLPRDRRFMRHLNHNYGES